MKKARKSKAKIKSKTWKALNKRKLVAVTAAKAIPAPRPAMVMAEETKLPFVFWPLEVMKWWMPSART